MGAKRRKIMCEVCGRYRHQTCPNCGQERLLGWRGIRGLFDHEYASRYTDDDSVKRAIREGAMRPHVCSPLGPTGFSGNPGSGEPRQVTATGGGTVTGSVQSGQQQGQGQAQGSGQSGQSGEPCCEHRPDQHSPQHGETTLGGRRIYGCYGTNAAGGGGDCPCEQSESEAEQQQQQQQQGQGSGANGGGSGDPPPDTPHSHEEYVTREEWIEGRAEDETARDSAIEAAIGPALDQRVDAAVAKRGGMKIEIKRPGGTSATVEGAHASLPLLLKLAAARVNVMMVGPAGSGKTHAGGMVADALELGFYPYSVGPATTIHELKGYNDASGRYVPGILFEPFVNGGVLLLDEIDSANPAALTTLNAALANDRFSFPHGVMTRHPDFVAIAAGNTYGRGADRMYVGRAQLDAATLNRFAVLDWPYDAALEGRLSESYAAAAPEHATIIREWLTFVQGARRSVEDQRLRVVVGTRDVIEGSKLLAQGIDGKTVAMLRFWAPLDHDTRVKVAETLSNAAQFTPAEITRGI